tara:strand:+ start:139 stop:648 length:510 start_codon:yes stop_codon:yes gene_type:complete
MKVIENFLPQATFDEFQKIILSNKAKFNIITNVDAQPDAIPQEEYWSWYLIHMVYWNDSPYSDWFQPIYNEFIPRLRGLKIFKSLMRIKINAFPYTETIHEHNKHVDYTFKHLGAIYYLNTCDGYTKLKDGTKIDSIANRLLIFDASEPHQSTTTTTARLRYNINFNFL